MAQHIMVTHPHMPDNDFSVSSNLLQRDIEKSPSMSSAKSMLGVGRIASTPTPTEKDFITDDDIKSERIDADNSEDESDMYCGDAIYMKSTQDMLNRRNKVAAALEEPPEMLCPLCQDPFGDKKSLEKHVMTIHSVNSDGLTRLLNLVDTSHWLNSNNGGSSSGGGGGTSIGGASKTNKGSGSSASSCADSTDIECLTCGATFKTMSDLFMHANDEQHFQLTGNSNDMCMCILRTCQQQFTSLPSMMSHFKDCHMNAVISERHVYKYRCKLCSLAFKTQEKLNVHSLYHTMREATKCHLCARNFRSLASLQKHMEQFHQGPTTNSPVTSPSLEKSSEYMDDYPMTGSPASSTKQDDTEMLLDMHRNSATADDQSSISTDVITETNEIDDYLQAMAEENYNDAMRKFKCTKCRMAFTSQLYLQQHLKSGIHRRNTEKMSTNYPLEKYLDPNRPFKCDICRESFTQKNILLVHYNSVSHLHKLKKQNETNTPSTSPTATVTGPSSSGIEFDRRSLEFDRKSVDFDRKSVEFNELDSELQKRKLGSTDNDYDSPKKRFRCDLCKVAYVQRSTLDIHMRSVLHQTRGCRQEQQQHGSERFMQQMSSISPTPISAAGGNPDLNDALKVPPSTSPKFNNPIYKTLLENFGFDIVKQLTQNQLGTGSRPTGGFELGRNQSEASPDLVAAAAAAAAGGIGAAESVAVAAAAAAAAANYRNDRSDPSAPTTPSPANFFTGNHQ